MKKLYFKRIAIFLLTWNRKKSVISKYKQKI